MATQLANKFTSYELTEEETRSGSIFSVQQVQVLQNTLSEIAHLKLGLTYDPLNPVDFAQQVAYAQGKLDVISYLIENSKATELALLEELALNKAVAQYSNQQ